MVLTVYSEDDVKMKNVLCISKKRTEVMWSHAAMIRARNPRDGPYSDWQPNSSMQKIKYKDYEHYIN